MPNEQSTRRSLIENLLYMYTCKLHTCNIVSKLNVSPFHRVNSPLDAPVTRRRPSGVHCNTGHTQDINQRSALITTNNHLWRNMVFCPTRNFIIFQCSDTILTPSMSKGKRSFKPDAHEPYSDSNKCARKMLIPWHKCTFFNISSWSSAFFKKTSLNKWILVNAQQRKTKTEADDSYLHVLSQGYRGCF